MGYILDFIYKMQPLNIEKNHVTSVLDKTNIIQTHIFYQNRVVVGKVSFE